MVHTASLTYFPSRTRITIFKNLPGTVYYEQDHRWYNGSLRDHGLQFWMYYIYDGKSFVSPRITCRINFRKIIDQSNLSRVEVMNMFDYEEVERGFDNLIADFMPSLPVFSEWLVNRIDYCINVKTPYVKEYLHLLKKGDRPNLKDWYDKKNRNYTQKKGSLYLVSTAEKRENRSITVNFYNKQDEIKSKLDPWDDDYQEMEILSANVLRLEIQCHKVKTESIKRKYGMHKKSVSYFLSPYITRDIIEYYLKRIGGEADYHRKKVAIQMIDQLPCQTQTKAKMKQIVEAVAVQGSSIAKVREKFAAAGIMDPVEYKGILLKMQKYNINPVTIRDNRHLDGKHLHEGLPNLMQLFDDAFIDETTISVEK